MSGPFSAASNGLGTSKAPGAQWSNDSRSPPPREILTPRVARSNPSIFLDTPGPLSCSTHRLSRCRCVMFLEVQRCIGVMPSCVLWDSPWDGSMVGKRLKGVPDQDVNQDADAKSQYENGELLDLQGIFARVGLASHQSRIVSLRLNSLRMARLCRWTRW